MNWGVIRQESKTDALLAALVDEAREYAQIYLLAKQRHKGCDGTGELMTLKEEFKDTVDTMIRYCEEKKHLAFTTMIPIRLLMRL
jgi:hypothetical protein